MSLPALTFANRFIYTDIYSEKQEGMIEFNKEQNRVLNITDYDEFSCGLTSDYQYKDLIQFADGKKIRMKYKMYKDTGILYTLLHSYEFTDANNNLVDFSGAQHLIYSNPSGEYTTSLAWDPTQPGYDTFPFSKCYYVPSFVDYHQSGRETVVGDVANSSYPCGRVFFKNPRPPVGGYVSFSGQETTATHGASYSSVYIPIISLSTEQAFNEYFGLVDPNNEWHQEGENPPAPSPSGPGGGDHPRDDNGDPVDFPDLPSTGVINTGLITLFNPDATKLRSFASVLWGNDFEQSIKKVLNDPFDGLIGLSMVPFSPTTSGSISCEIGNFDTEIQMPLVSAQYYTIDCGTVQLAENWGNALDYNATTVEIFVPFVGFRVLDIQDCMNRTLALKYNVDVLTGAAIAILKCGNKCLYEWPCNVSYNIPLTGSNKAALYTGLISIAMSGLGGLARGGAMGAVGGAATSAINVATSSQSDVQRGGSLASNTGVLGEFLPYIVVHRPKQSMPQNFKGIKGYQSNITSILGYCQGYTEVDYIHLTGISGATDTELQEIERLLKEGVII